MASYARSSAASRKPAQRRPSLSGAARIHAIDTKPREIPRSLSASTRSNDGGAGRLNRRSSSAGSVTASLASLGISTGSGSAASRRPIGDVRGYSELKKNEEKMKEEIAELKAQLEEKEKKHEEEMSAMRKRLARANEECHSQEARVDMLSLQIAEATVKSEAMVLEWKQKLEKTETTLTERAKSTAVASQQRIDDLTRALDVSERRVKVLERQLESHGISAVDMGAMPLEVVERAHAEVEEFLDSMSEMREMLQKSQEQSKKWTAVFSCPASA